MTWLLLGRFRDYKGKGLFDPYLHQRVAAGRVVDEPGAGYPPARFYGWSDMLVNSSSAVIGVLTILWLEAAKGAIGPVLFKGSQGSH
jgi:hypothetical protein